MIEKLLLLQDAQPHSFILTLFKDEQIVNVIIVKQCLVNKALRQMIGDNISDVDFDYSTLLTELDDVWADLSQNDIYCKSIDNTVTVINNVQET